MKDPLIFQALSPIIQVLDVLGISYQIVGSVASSAYGIARATLDVDLSAEIKTNHVHSIFDRLQNSYYIDEDRINDAASLQSSFNAIHLESMIKVDVFVLKSGDYDQAAFARRRIEDLGESTAPRLLYIASPEDVVLYKLDWYRQGGRVSERQWTDILGVLKVQQTALDMEYMRKWASTLGLKELLLQALRDAGISQ
jgi:hypothetical protein